MTQDLHHLAAAYALDALDPEERADFEAHYPTCEICSGDVAEYRETAAALAAGVAEPPPAHLKSMVMSEITRTRQISPRVPDKVIDLTERRRSRRTLLVAAAAAAVIALFGAVAVLRSTSDDGIDDVLAAGDAVVTALDGADGSIRIVWSDDLGRAVVFGNDLPDPGDQLTYELWFLQADGVASAGLFHPHDGHVRTLLETGDLAGLGWAVTIEPEGGSGGTPTGDVVYQGDL